jgi:hypothetical protein
MKPRTVPKPLSPTGKTLYLIANTAGFALMATGILWLVQLGCAINISAQLLSGRFSPGGGYMTWVGCCIVLLALASSEWMFANAYRSGHVWQRPPQPWWWVGFISIAWAGVLISELKKRKP